MPIEPERRDRITALADLQHGVGLEIGPLHRPITDKSTHDVRYVDVFDTEKLKAHYRGHPGGDFENIPELDFWLESESGEIRGIDEAAKSAAPYSWVVASHVIEHVPDIVGWLGQLAQITEDGGSLVLVVPDRRYSFDALRPPTTVGQLLQAHDADDKVPSIRAVYDHSRNAVSVTSPDMWLGKRATVQDRIHHFEYAMDQVALVRDEGNYVDCHVWLFTPGEFVSQIAELGRLGVIDFYLDTIVPTAKDELEFFAVLKRLPRNISADQVDGIRASGVLEFTDTAPPPAESAPTPEPAPVAGPGREAGPGAVWFEISPLEVRLITAKRRTLAFLLRRK